MLKELIPNSWQRHLRCVTETESFRALDAFVESEYATKTVYPKKENIFNAITGLNPENVKVVILGQDPYHEPGQAHGLSFSVKSGKYPPSLVNIFTELKNDLGIEAQTGNLEKWKKQGVLLLNTVLTVREHEANSHKDKGWEEVTAEILKTVLWQPQYKVCILWGSPAKNLFWGIHDMQQDVGYVSSVHPSPLSAYRGFFGSKPFSKTNQMLERHGIAPIDWTL